ncbi:MAG: hypothetical protein ACT4OI_05790, partial [Methanobacteriota archaeon]
LVLGGGVASGVVSGDLTRFVLVPWAMGLVFFGYAYDRPEVLWDRARGRRVLAAYALFADGGIHMLAIGEHVDTPLHVAFFAILAPIQLASAWLLIRGGPGLLRAWLLGGIGLIVLYVLSRVPELPLVGAEYRVEPLGIVSKAIEIVLVAAIVQELRTAHREARRAASRPATQT